VNAILDYSFPAWWLVLPVAAVLFGAACFLIGAYWAGKRFMRVMVVYYAFGEEIGSAEQVRRVRETARGN
jgi:hypothetical protein